VEEGGCGGEGRGVYILKDLGDVHSRGIERGDISDMCGYKGWRVVGDVCTMLTPSDSDSTGLRDKRETEQKRQYTTQP
jgi:hypothetical protein